MMWWIVGALTPLLLCGLMCVAGGVAAFFGLRRIAEPSSPPDSLTEHAKTHHVDAES